jgi:hypothetical protein
MAKRKSTGKRQRFNIFKRDKFTCQYCGGTPPAVVLVVDHIVPVAAGGQDALATDLGIYWCNRTHPGQFTFGPDRMTSARTFLKRLPAAEIYDAIDIAFSRRPPRYKNDNDTFKYFCGICWAKIKERGGS